jgi:O-antigen/teichoic acid export membrane protein
MSEATRRVGSAVFWSLFARAARFGLGLASSVIVVRGLGQHDYGVLSVVRAVLAFALVIAAAGLGQSLLKFLPVFRVEGALGRGRLLIRRVFVIQTAVWIVMIGVTLVLRRWLEHVFAMDGVGLIAAVAVCLSVFELYFTLLSHVLNSAYDTRLLSLASVASHVVFIVLLLVLVPRGGGVLGVLVASAAGQLVASIIVVRKALSVFPADRAAETPGGSIERERLLRFSLPFALIGLLNVIVWRQSETLFLAHYRTAAETGFFDLAYRLPQTILEFIPATVWPIIMAGISEVYARNEARLSSAIDRYYRVLFLLSTPICVYGVALGGRIVPILFGEAMTPAAVPAQVFFGIFTVSFLSTPLSMALYVMERSYVNLLIILTLAVVNVSLDLLLIPRFGITGAVIPVAFVIVLQPFVYKWAVGRFVRGIHIPYAFIGRCLAASSPTLLVLPVSRYVRGPVELVVATVLSMVLVMFAAKKIRLIGREEIDMLGSIPIPAVDRLLRFIGS